MDLHHQFEVAAPVGETWTAFLDMPRIAPCMPGTEVTEVIDERNVTGAARIKVGPINLRFTGKAAISQVEEAEHAALLTASGSDAKGRGNADADVRFALADVGGGQTSVDVHTTLNLTGSVAQYGRASGLVDEIANQLIAEFVRCLEGELGRDTSSTDNATAPDASAAAAAAETTPVSGLRLFFRALVASITKWFRRGA